MTITQETLKILWGKSGNRCAFPDCNQLLTEELDNISGNLVTGEQAHIVGKSAKGPRTINSSLDSSEINKYGNIILLCARHHKLIDDNEENYPINEVLKMKYQHEQRVNDALSPEDQKKNRDDVLYLQTISDIFEIMKVSEWHNWTSFILGSEQGIEKSTFNNLNKVYRLLAPRISSNRYKSLDKAISNFCKVLNVFVKVYELHMCERGDSYFTQRFYKVYHRYDENVYNVELMNYDFHTRLVIDLIIECTKALNYIIDQVRENISDNYRSESGYIYMYKESSDIIISPNYSEVEDGNNLFHSLNNFIAHDRFRYDYHFGVNDHLTLHVIQPWYNEYLYISSTT